jgi:hypothetical protein
MVYFNFFTKFLILDVGSPVLLSLLTAGVVDTGGKFIAVLPRLYTNICTTAADWLLVEVALLLIGPTKFSFNHPSVLELHLRLSTGGGGGLKGGSYYIKDGYQIGPRPAP